MCSGSCRADEGVDSIGMNASGLPSATLGSMRAFAVALTVLALGATLSAQAVAKTPRTFCGKIVHAARGTIDRRVNGVTVWHRGLVIHACSDRFRREYALLITGKGVRVALVRASNRRCLALVLSKAGALPQIVFRDLGARQGDSAAQTVGFGAVSASVGSLAVSSNCAAAWGQTVTDAAGGSVSSIIAKGFGAATALSSAASQIAIVAGPDDTKNVDVVAADRGVTVSWKESGARKAASLP